MGAGTQIARVQIDGTFDGRSGRRCSDAALVVRFRAGDETAFSALYERHRGRAFSACMAVLGSPADAEDALQESFVRLATKLRQPGEHAVRALLAKIAHDTAVDVARSRARRETVDSRAQDRVSEQGADRRVHERAELDELLASVKRLPENQRSALLMRELAGFSRREIAATLGVDEGIVRYLVEQARVKIRLDRDSRELGCSEVRSVLSSEVDGRRRPALVRRHVRLCTGCRELAASGSVLGRLRGWLPVPGLDPIWRLLGRWRGQHAPPAAPPGALEPLLANLGKLLAVAVLALGGAKAAEELTSPPQHGDGGDGPKVERHRPRDGLAAGSARGRREGTRPTVSGAVDDSRSHVAGEPRYWGGPDAEGTQAQSPARQQRGEGDAPQLPAAAGHPSAQVTSQADGGIFGAWPGGEWTPGSGLSEGDGLQREQRRRGHADLPEPDPVQPGVTAKDPPDAPEPPPRPGASRGGLDLAPAPVGG